MNNLAMQNIETGKGNITQEKIWNTSPVIANFTWDPSSGAGLDSDIYVTFKADLTLYINRSDVTLCEMNVYKPGLKFSVFNGNVVEWTFYVYVAIPYDYRNNYYKFNLSLPMDWKVIFVAEDSTPTTNRTADCNIGIGYIEVYAYSISQASPDGYWIFKAKSPNYVSDVWTQVYNATANQWENSTTFRQSNITRVVARILNSSGLPPADVTSYSASITIRFSNGTIWYTALATPDVNGYVISNNITIGGVNTTGDLYTVEVHWNSQVEAGDLQRQFSVIHRTSLSIWNPPDARTDLQAEAYYGDLVLLTVRFHDEDSGRLLTGATVTCNWTTGDLTLADKGTGEYEVTLNTSQLAGNGRYIIVITAQKSYYDIASITFTLDVYYRTVLSSPQAPEYGVPIPIGDNLTVDLYYEKADTKVGISNASITANGTWNGRILKVREVDTGHYVVYFNTSGLTAGYQAIQLTANKSFYEAKDITIRFLFVYKTKYSPDSLAIYVGYNENFTVWFKYMYYNDSPVLGATVKVYVPWLNQWVPMDDQGNGNYTVILNASVPMASVYSLIFRANKTLHQSWEVSPVTVVVWERGTLLEVIYPSGLTLNVTWGENATIEVRYLDAVTKAGIANADVRVDWRGSSYVNMTLNSTGTYLVEISTSEIKVIGSYTLVVTLDSPTYKSNSTLITVIVGKREGKLIAEPSELTVVWSDIRNVTLSYFESKSGTGVSNALTNSNLTLAVSIVEEGGGTYTLIFDSTKVNVGNYTIKVVFDHSLTKTAACIIKVHVVPVSTEISVLEKDESAPIGDLFNFTILYKDLNHSKGIDKALIVANWTYGYHVENIGGGKYRISLVTETVPIGEYHIVVVAKQRNYVESSEMITVRIRLIKTRIDVVSAPQVYFTQLGNITVQVWDIDHNETVDYALIVSNLTRPPEIRERGNGIYAITFDTAFLDVGTYAVQINASRTNYEPATVTVMVEILPIPTSYRLYIIGANITGQVISVIEGSTFNITVEYIDTLHDEKIEGATVYLVFPNGTEIALYEIGGGNYTIKIDTRELETKTYNITLVLSKSHYQEQRIQLYLRVESKPVVPTKVLLMGLLTGSGVAAGVFALAASWYFYFRFPAFVRLTRSISKRLMRGKTPKFGKVREREEIVRDLIRRDYGTIVPPSFLEKPEVEVEVPEVEEVSEELVEAGEETLKEVTETIETLTGIEAPRELKRLIEEEKEEIEETEEKVEREEREEAEEGKED